ncbi:MAG TPA: deoxyribose-phosphate aldolase [Holophagaceae bacterium]|nr:deoxyribose-phosphate aldolase [Holophagaceae bacterium]
MSLLLDLGREAATRLEGRPLPAAGAPAQLLACGGGRALLRSGLGLVEVPLPPEGAEPPFDLAPLIDHTLLKAEATARQVERLCEESLEHGFAAVCVNPAWVGLAAKRLQGSAVRVCTVAGFPLGATTARQKAGEAAAALEDGAQEIDAVLPIGLARAGGWDAIRGEFDVIRQSVPRGRGVLKVILETCLLDDAQKLQACRAAEEAGLDFVKTSTGFGPGGATEADVALMRSAVGARLGVKASGGIRSYGEALRMVRAGATRLGLSASVPIARGGGSSPSSGY